MFHFRNPVKFFVTEYYKDETRSKVKSVGISLCANMCDFFTHEIYVPVLLVMILLSSHLTVKYIDNDIENS